MGIQVEYYVHDVQNELIQSTSKAKNKTFKFKYSKLQIETVQN
jgi:hypothetical protein